MCIPEQQVRALRWKELMLIHLHEFRWIWFMCRFVEKVIMGCKMVCPEKINNNNNNNNNNEHTAKYPPTQEYVTRITMTTNAMRHGWAPDWHCSSGPMLSGKRWRVECSRLDKRSDITSCAFNNEEPFARNTADDRRWLHFSADPTGFTKRSVSTVKWGQIRSASIQRRSKGTGVGAVHAGQCGTGATFLVPLIVQY